MIPLVLWAACGPAAPCVPACEPGQVLACTVDHKRVCPADCRDPAAYVPCDDLSCASDPDCPQGGATTSGGGSCSPSCAPGTVLQCTADEKELCGAFDEQGCNAPSEWVPCVGGDCAADPDCAEG